MIKDIILKLPSRTYPTDVLKIGDFKAINVKRRISTEQVFDNWFYNNLEVMYPELTPYEREFVFVYAFCQGMGKVTYSGHTTCPNCGNESCGIALKISPEDELTDFSVIIPDPDTGEDYVKLMFELPNAPGELVKNPEIFYHLNVEYHPEEFEEYEIKPCSTDLIVLKDGTKQQWSAFIPDDEIEKLIRPESGPYLITEIDDETKKAIREYIFNFNTVEKIRQKSLAPVKSVLSVRCRNCKTVIDKDIHRALDIVKIIISEDLQGLYQSLISQAVVFCEQGFLSYTEIDNMGMMEFNAVSAAIKKLKESQK